MTIENFLALGESLAKVERGEQIAFAWLPDEVPMDFEIKHRMPRLRNNG